MATCQAATLPGLQQLMSLWTLNRRSSDVDMALSTAAHHRSKPVASQLSSL